VEIAPAAARVELDKLTADGTIKKFTVAGVYVNYFYSSLPFSGSTALSTLLDGGNTASHYVSTANPGGSAPDYTTLTSVWDEPATASSAGVAELASSEVFAYNLLVPNTTNYFPHIVIKLTDVFMPDLSATDDNPYTGTWFLTIGGVKDGTGAVYLEKANVYHIADLAFSLGDLGPIPEPGVSKQVYVDVTVKAWTVQTVTPVLK
jgi:hypothetical protein